MKVTGSIKINAYEIVARAVETGAAMGVSRAYKYSDAPTHDAIANSVEEEVMNALSDVLVFETGE